MAKELSNGPALWRQGVGDIPVEIIEDLGEVDGKRYYLVKGINKNFKGHTGVPEDELIQEDTDE